MLIIEAVSHPSPASLAGLRKHDRLVLCNGYPLDDWIDFYFSAGTRSIEIEYMRGPVARRMELKRRPNCDWGLIFRGQSPARCRRKCVFCFVDQLPEDVRPTLKVKDDDIRYSFLQGTYVTLTPTDADFALSRGLSPIHVSVHAVDPDVRGYMLGTGREEPVLDLLRKLSAAGIHMETQIVILPGVNDGDELEHSLRELFRISGVRSVTVVPVGLTRHRKGLPDLRRPTMAESRKTVQLCNIWRKRALEERDCEWVYPSDEFFVLGKLPVPDCAYYRCCTVAENGVGLLAELMKNEGMDIEGRGYVITGTMAAPYLQRILKGSSYEVLPVQNRYLGEEVSVAGLLSGRDVIDTVRTTGSLYN
ncbi:MAG: DUF512 domain-containing protein, partial [Candidatus Aegiribacteria sp.]|nr:DUF512 domain-containing protein [Candidatus Aegiribacteria sp.]MBD3295353.1 DUF512 domain-containing protein [Candidatus Fermentibacteria bacterium]